MNAVATRQPTQIEVLKSNLTKRADDFKLVLPAHITPEKFQRVIATAAIQNPQLLQCDRQSLLLASMKLAQDGLLPDGREAALVPFKTRVKGDDDQYHDKWVVQPMPMAYGLRKKILQTGEVLSLETGVVYLSDLQSGHFIYEIGLEPPIRYRPNLLLPLEETVDDKIVAAYSIARIKNEGGEPFWSVEVMRRAEIDKVRQASQTGAVGRTIMYGKKKGQPIEPKGPWVDWFGEMARKTVLRRHAKVLPMSGDILETFNRDIEAERDADRAASESAAAFLSVEPNDPVILPSAEDLAEGQTIDNQTGEVLTDRRGMTEVDEETARALDAGEGYDPETGEVAEPEHDDKPAWWGQVNWIRNGVPKAKNKQGVKEFDDEFLKIRVGLPDDVIDELDALIASKRAELTKPKAVEG